MAYMRDANGVRLDTIGVATTAAVTAEAGLARNADNLTSGTVADARIASTLQRNIPGTAATWTKYGDYLARPTRPTIVAIGASITDINSTNQTWNGSFGSRSSAFNHGYYVQALIDLRQTATVWDVGISGQTAADGLARFDTDVTPLKPPIVIEDFASNDIITDRGAAATFADKLAMWQKVWAWGGKVIAFTCPPRATFSTAQRQQAHLLNRMLLRFGAANPDRIAVVDQFAAWADPLTDAWLTGYSGDGAHPNGAGALALSSVLGAAIRRFSPPLMEPLSVSDLYDAANLVPNPMLANGSAGSLLTGTSGTCVTGWALLGSGATGVGSIVNRTDSFGKWQQITVTGTGEVWFYRNVTGWAVGNVVAAFAEIETDAAGWVDGKVSVALWCRDAASQFLHIAEGPTGWTAPAGRHASGVVATPAIEIPPNTTTVTIVMRKAAAGTARFGRPCVTVLPTS